MGRLVAGYIMGSIEEYYCRPFGFLGRCIGCPRVPSSVQLELHYLG